MKKRLLILFVLAVVLAACKKKVFEPLPESNSPIFSIEGEFGSKNIAYYAGESGMEMTSGLEMRNGVQYAFSEFKDGTRTYKLGVYDGNVTIPNLTKSIEIGDTLYFAQKPTQQLAYLSVNQLSNYYKFQNVEWYANDVYLGNGNISMYEPGVYDIRGIFTFDNDSIYSVVNKMVLGFSDERNFSIYHYLSDPNELKLWLEGETQDIDSIQWYVGDEHVWTGTTCTKTISPYVHRVKAKVFYNDQTIKERTILVDGNFSGHFVEDFGVFRAPDQSALWDYMIGLEVEEDGETYSSFDLPNYKGALIVKSANLYNHPITGVKMIRIEADLDAKLKAESTGNIISTKLLVKFGFPYPD